MAGFMEEMGITQVEKVTKTSLNSYILYLEKEGKAAATISGTGVHQGIFQLSC